MQKVDTVTRTVTATQHLLFFHVKLAMQANGVTQKVLLPTAFVLVAKPGSIPRQ